MIDAETVAQAREGDAVKIGTTSHTWQSPMTVAEADCVEWDVPFGEDWTTATLRLESAQTAYYAIVDSHGDVDAGLYSETYHDDVGRRIAPLGTFEIVERGDAVAITPGDDPAPCVRHVGPSEYTAPREVPSWTRQYSKGTLFERACLALGVAPQDATIDKSALIRVAARVTDRDKGELHLETKRGVLEAIATALGMPEVAEDGEGGPYKDFVARLHVAVVPEWYSRPDQFPQNDWAQVVAHADVPDWLTEREFHDVCDDAHSVRDAARRLGWDDVHEVRRTIAFAGRYEDLPEPEAKGATKYQAVPDGGAQ